MMHGADNETAGDSSNDLNRSNQRMENNQLEDQDQLQQDDFNGTAYPWMRHVEWMRQAQPVSPERFPRTTGPTVYEGYIPASDQSNFHLSTEEVSTNFLWPAQKPPPLPLPRTDHINRVEPQLSHSLSGTVPFGDASRTSYPSLSRAQTPTLQYQPHPGLSRSRGPSFSPQPASTTSNGIRFQSPHQLSHNQLQYLRGSFHHSAHNPLSTFGTEHQDLHATSRGLQYPGGQLDYEYVHKKYVSRRSDEIIAMETAGCHIQKAMDEL
jgi:hypothetical protein